MNATTATPGQLAQWLIDNPWDDDWAEFALSVKTQMEARGATKKQVDTLRWMVRDTQKHLNGYDPLEEWTPLRDVVSAKYAPSFTQDSWDEGRPSDYGDR